LIEFTGERVVPGQVDADLWNEHLARYAFAARLAPGRRVLDAGCGTGYGSAELAETARDVVALDLSHDAVRHASGTYARANLRFLQASCAALPLSTGSVELAVAYEVIEHIPDWQAFLHELRRVIAPSGQLVVSTPNKDYYAATRRQTGPNPYHVHEFALKEFLAELRALFPYVTLYLQNHVEGIAFQPVEPDPAAVPQLHQQPRAAEPATAHFFLAVCSASPQAPPPPFLYVPSTANVLRERELHIDKLEIDVAQLRTQKQELVEMFREQKQTLDTSNRWAHELDEKLTAAGERIVALQDELAVMRAGYEAKVAELEQENVAKTEWALRLNAQLNLVRASRWVKLGNRVGLGPALEQ
jgi:ubiquinone/menaquinone biosynthesis C-methylase UbiE